MLISKFDTSNINIDTLEAFESKYNITLPDEYKRFLLKYNGGETPKTDFELNRVVSDIEGFYGFGDIDKLYNFESLERYDFFSEGLKDKMLPIGDNCFGDHIMLDVGEKHNGRICFLYHDRPKKYVELAQDFTTFVSKCRSEKTGHIRTIEERRADMVAYFGEEIDITPERLARWQAEIDHYAKIHQEELIIDEK